jgi:hypothetical protein
MILTSALSVPMGLSGTAHSGGRILDEYARGLVGSMRAAEVYREMRDSPLGGAFVSVMRLVIGQLKIAVETPEGLEQDPVAQAHRDDWRARVRLLRQPLIEVVQEMAENAATFGMGLQEPIVRIEDGRWITIDLEPRSAETIYQWRFDSDDHPTAVQQRLRDGRSPWVELERAVHVPLPTANRNPEGRSLFRSAWPSWVLIQQLITDEAIGIGRDLTGVPDMEIPAEYLDAENNTAEAVAIREHYEMIGTRLKAGKAPFVLRAAAEDRNGKTGYGLRLMTSGGTQRVVPDVPIRRHAAWMMISLLSEFLLLGTSDTAGSSRALADPKISLAKQSFASIVNRILGGLSEQWIRRLHRWEGRDPAYAPRLVSSAIDAPTVVELVEILSKASGAGLLPPSEEIAAHILRGLGITTEGAQGA